jgi:leucyl aminopeptidase
MLLSVALLLSTSQLGLGSSFGDAQAVLGLTPQVQDAPTSHVVDEAILAVLKMHPDPVDALLSLQPDLAAELALPRLLHIVGEREPEWLTEGDKLRLRRHGKKFVDITEHHDFYAQQAETALAGKASKLASQTPPRFSLGVHSFLQTYPSLRISASLSPSSPISRHRECTMS